MIPGQRSYDRRSLDSETVFDCAGQQKKITAIEKQMGDPSFWNNQESAHQVIAQLKSLKVIVDPLVEVQQQLGLNPLPVYRPFHYETPTAANH